MQELNCMRTAFPHGSLGVQYISQRKGYTLYIHYIVSILLSRLGNIISQQISSLASELSALNAFGDFAKNKIATLAAGGTFCTCYMYIRSILRFFTASHSRFGVNFNKICASSMLEIRFLGHPSEQAGNAGLFQVGDVLLLRGSN